MRAALLAGFALVLAGSPAAGADGADAPVAGAAVAAEAERARRRPPLVQRFRRAERLSGGRLGIAALHLESGEGVGHRATERFPMASTFKLAVALHALHLAERGALDLARLETLGPADRNAGPGPLDAALLGGEVAVSVDSLIAAMMLHSDNSACDRLLALAGGPEAVTARVRALGVTGLDVDRTERELLRDQADRAAFARDPRDTATPDAMIALLRRYALGDALGRDAAERLRGLLERTPTGPRRIRAGAPATAIVAHKTGTHAEGANDVGIVTLPEGRGRLLLAVFVTDSSAPLERRERAIAEATRAACAVFLAADAPAGAQPR